MLPRRFRPHMIVVKQYGKEDDDGVAKEYAITINYVKVDTSYGIQQSKKGIDTDDKIVVYIELMDYIAYDADNQILRYGEDFKINTANALIYGGNHYEVSAVNEIFLDSDNPVRIEVIAK